MALNNLVGTECPTEIAKLINEIIAQKATNSLDNLDAEGQKKFTDLANSITNVNDLVTALSALVDTKLSAEALLEQNGYIKFSNGIILQWLNVTNAANQTRKEVSLPCALKKYYSVAAIHLTDGTIANEKFFVGIHKISLSQVAIIVPTTSYKLASDVLIIGY